MSIANPHLHAKSPEDKTHLSLKRWATVASLSVAVVLIVVKFMAYMVTDSVSLLSSLMDSSFDAVASLVTMVSVIHAASPADHEHRYGHGKLEAMAAMAQAIFIFGSAGFLLFESMHRFIHPQTVHRADIGINVMLFSVLLTVFLVLFQKHVIKKTSSIAITADHLHYKGDLLMNLSVLAALALSAWSPWPYFDPLFAAVISLELLNGAWNIGHEAFHILLDKELPDVDRERIIALVNAHPATKAVHDLRTRSTGTHIFIEFHQEIDGNMTVNAAHDVTEDLEKTLYDAFPNAEVLIHQEPAGIDDHRLDDKIRQST